MAGRRTRRDGARSGGLAGTRQSVAAGSDESSLRRRDGGPTLGRRDGEPTLGRRDGEPSLRRLEDEPSPRRRDDEPTLGRRDGEPSLRRLEGEPSPRRRDDEPTLGRRDGEPTADSRERAAEPEPDPEATARQICLRLLTTAPRTRAQLAAALQRRGVPEDAADAVLARFAEVKLIDDAMFAKAWVDSRHHGRGLAGRALGAELRQRGVSQDDIKAALTDLDPERELATARKLIERRLPATAGMATQARIRRLVGVLARKGYSGGLAYRVVREALEREAGEGHVSVNDLDFEPFEIAAADDEQEAADA
jgi:regulatory protein